MDSRTKKLRMALKGHEDFNFSVKFMENYYVASGG